MITASSPFEDTDSRWVAVCPTDCGARASGRMTNSSGTLPVLAALNTIVWPSGPKRALVTDIDSHVFFSKVIVAASGDVRRPTNPPSASAPAMSAATAAYLIQPRRDDAFRGDATDAAVTF